MGHVSTDDLFRVMADLRKAERKLDGLMRFAEGDMVRPVYCRECKHYRRHAHDRGVDDRCDLWNRETRARDFCSVGERREKDG